MLSHKQHVYTQFCHTKPCHTWVFSRRILSHMALSAAVFSSNLSSTVSFLVFSLLKNWHVGISRPISSWVPVLALFPAFLVVLLASRPFSLLSPSPCCPSGVCWVRLGHMFFPWGSEAFNQRKYDLGTIGITYLLSSHRFSPMVYYIAILLALACSINILSRWQNWFAVDMCRDDFILFLGYVKGCAVSDHRFSTLDF